MTSYPDSGSTDALEAGKLEAVPLRHSLKLDQRYLVNDAVVERLDSKDDGLLPQDAGGFHHHLHATRIVSVFCVAVDHYNNTFGYYNVLFSQHWVLQYLVLVSGICFALSKKSLMMFNSRLAAYFCLGVMVNLGAWMYMRLPWQDNMFNVIFQHWFVADIIIFSIILAPLRLYLRHVAHADAAGERRPCEPPFQVLGAERDAMVYKVIVFAGGFLALISAFKYVVNPAMAGAAPAALSFFASLGMKKTAWGSPTTLEEADQYIKDTCGFLFLTCSNVYLTLILPLIVRRLSLVPWVVLFNTYAYRAVVYRAAYERTSHMFDLFMIAQICYYFGLRHRKTIGNYVVRYWFVVLFLAALLWEPTRHERLDMTPPKDILLRARYALAEFLFVFVWLVAGERLVHPEIFTQDRLGFLNEWSLALFLFHKAAFIAVPAPWSWVVLLALAPIASVALSVCRAKQ